MIKAGTELGGARNKLKDKGKISRFQINIQKMKGKRKVQEACFFVMKGRILDETANKVFLLKYVKDEGTKDKVLLKSVTYTFAKIS